MDFIRRTSTAKDSSKLRLAHLARALRSRGFMRLTRLALLPVFVSPAFAFAPPGPVLPTPSFVLEGNSNKASLGEGVATAGDVNNDGFSDLIVGAPQDSNGQIGEGRALLFLGGANGYSSTPTWTAESDQAGAAFGHSVAPAGDVNADGFDDVVIGAPGYDNGQTDEGRVYLYLGNASGLNATPAVTLESNSAGAVFGWSVNTAGDVDGDGRSDIIVGAPAYSNGQTSEGRAYVYLGAGSSIASLPTFTFESDFIAGLLGTSVSTAGDIDADGRDDIVIGAPGIDAPLMDEGAIYVFRGKIGGIDPTLLAFWPGYQAAARLGTSVSTAGDVNGDGLADVVAGAPGYGLSSEGAVYYYQAAPGQQLNFYSTSFGTQPFERLGTSVQTAGDVNGDGLADVVAGAPTHGTGIDNNAGALKIYLGSANGIQQEPHAEIQGPKANAMLGQIVATAGDFDGDGRSDVVAGAPHHTNGDTDEGAIYVYRGAGVLTEAIPSLTLDGTQSGSQLGRSLAFAGDVNGDGYSDLLVSAHTESNGQTSEGRAYLHLGSETGTSFTPAWSAESNQDNALFGYSLAGAGDVNGDGYDDAIIGAMSFDNGQSDEGRASLYLGSATGLQNTAAWTVESNQNFAFLGWSVASAGDVNGDGYGDVIVGVPFYDNGQSDEGRAMLYLGSASGLPTTPSWLVESNLIAADFGQCVASAGDINGDGYGDVLVGAPGLSNGQSSEGRAFLYLGSPSGLATSPAWTAEGNQNGANFGFSLATAGDLNGDGFSDVVIGAPGFDGSGMDNGMASVYLGSASGLATSPVWSYVGSGVEALGDRVATAGDVDGDGFSDLLVAATYSTGFYSVEGRALLFRGSATGPNVVPDWTLTGGSANAQLGSVAGAGDANGDGFADIALGAWTASIAPFTQNGRVRIALGNGGDGMDRKVRQARTDNSAPVALLGVSNAKDAFRIKALARTAAGRDGVKLQWEVKPNDKAFDGLGVGTAAKVDTGVPGMSGSGSEQNQLVGGLLSSKLHHWRVRTVSDNPFFPASPWLSLAGNSTTEGDIRTLNTCSIAFTSIGPGLAGKGGFVPNLTANNGNCLIGGTTLTMTAGLGGASGLLFIGFNQANLSFYGGHFYLALPVVTVPLTLPGTPGTAGAGGFSIPGSDVTSFSGNSFYFQCAFADPAAIKGVSLSNGLKMTITP